MDLSSDTIRALQKFRVNVTHTKTGERLTKPLIEGADDERMGFIEGSAFDFVLDRVSVPGVESPYIGVDYRDTMKAIELPPERYINPEGIEVEGWFFEPMGAYLVESREAVNLPVNLLSPNKVKSSISRSFVLADFSDAHPNYQGTITGLFFVVHPCGFRIERGARFAYCRFRELDSRDTDAYRGVYGTDGHRTTTNGPERPF